MTNIQLSTIGFTKKDARTFFSIIKNNKVKKLFDIRLNNVSQLAGFAKKNDLTYFLQQLCECDYAHEPLLAPNKEILDAYKKKEIDWPEYEVRFNKLLAEREAHNVVSSEELDGACLLCSEPTADQCHRRLVAEYLQKYFPNISIAHI